MRNQIAKYDESTLIDGINEGTKKFSFEWNVFSENGSIAYCGRVIAETLEKAMIRSWLEIEGSEWFKFGHGHVIDDINGGYYVDWECKQELYCGRGGF